MSQNIDNPVYVPPIPPQAVSTGSTSDSGQADLFAWINDEDLNGECFIAGELGELEEFRKNRLIVFPNSVACAANPNEKVDYSIDDMKKFVKLNLEYAYRTENNISPNVAIRVAYVRFLAAQQGLVSPAFDKSSHRVKYNEAVYERDIKEDLFVRNYDQNVTSQAKLDKETRDKIRKNFTDIVCTIAYMFRVRGHHYLEDMRAKYEDIWQKCLKKEPNPGIEWNFLAHNALHAIFPDILDAFWTLHVENGSVAGALVKRYDAPPAGVAAIRAVAAGAEDLRMAIPGIQDRFRDRFDELEKIVSSIKANRWEGSINRKFYNAGRIVFDENRFSAISAVVISSLQAFAADSPLLQSPSLKRVAANARITGGIVARGIATAASDPNLVKSVLKIGAYEPDLK